MFTFNRLPCCFLREIMKFVLYVYSLATVVLLWKNAYEHLFAILSITSSLLSALSVKMQAAVAAL